MNAPLDLQFSPILANIAEERAKPEKAVGQLVIPPSHDLRRGEEILVFVRPSDVELLDLADETVRDNAFQGIIEKATYLGDKVDYRIRAGNNLEMRAQVGGMGRFTRGDTVKVHLFVDRCKGIVGG